MHGNAIQDEFSHIKDRSARRYFRRKRDHLCPTCGLKPELHYVFCARHRKLKKKHYKRTYKPKATPHKHTPRPSKYLTNETSNP